MGTPAPRASRVERLGILLVAPLATLLLLAPLLGEKPRVLTGGDISAHVQFAVGLLDSFRAGVPFPRWLSDVNYGLGGPIFIFYPPLSYYLAALSVWVAGGKAVLGFDIAFALAGMACAVAFYAASRGLVGRPAALFGAFLYTLAPYHAFDLHAGYYAEYVAYAWLPLIWWFTRRVLDEPPTPRQAAPLGLCGALLAMTHLPTTVTLAITLAPYVAIRLLRAGQIGKRLAVLLGAAGVALLCAAAFLLPMQLERGLVDTAYVTQSPWGDYRQWLVSLTGFGSLPWLSAFTGGLLLTLPAAYGLIVTWRAAGPGEGEPREDRRRAEAIAMGSLVVLSLFLQLGISSPLWELIPQLPLIQFPWRFNSPHALGCCVLVALALSRPLGGPSSSRRRFLVAGALALPAVVLALGLRALPRVRIDQHAFETDVHVKHRQIPEFLPVPVPRSAPSYTADDALFPPAAWSREGGRHEIRQWSPEHRELVVSTNQLNRLEIRTYFYPGWRARLNGRPVPLDRPMPPLFLLAVRVPPGENQRLEFFFGSTPLRNAAAALSAAGLLLVVLLLGTGRGRPRAPRASQVQDAAQDHDA
jgi:6-pyruvoyl-tetrahydropterin synthase-like protein